MSVDAFALAIVAGGEPPAFPGLSGHEPDLPAARRSAAAIGRAMDEIVRLLPERGAYVSEGNYFDSVW